MEKVIKFCILLIFNAIMLFSCENDTYQEKTLVNVEIATQPIKKTYNIGDVFDITGMLVTAFFDDGSIEPVDITSDMLIYDFTNAGIDIPVTVSITHNGVTKTADIKGVTVIKPIEYELGPLRKILDGYVVKVIAFDSKGNAWIGTQRQGVIRYNEEETIVYNAENSALPQDLFIWSIDVDKNDNVWIGSDSGAWKYDGKEFMLYNSSNTVMPEDIVWNVAVDAQNNIWFASSRFRRGGLVRYDGTTWQAYTPDNSPLPTNSINGIAIDQSNNVWLSLSDYTNQAFLVKISNDSWDVYDENDFGFKPYYLGGIQCDSKSRLWVSIDYSLSSALRAPAPHFFIFDGNNTTQLSYSNNINTWDLGSRITIDHNDYVWHHGVGAGCRVWIDMQWKEFERSYFGGSSVWVIKEDPKNKLWFGTENGIYIQQCIE